MCRIYSTSAFGYYALGNYWLVNHMCRKSRNAGDCQFAIQYASEVKCQGWGSPTTGVIKRKLQKHDVIVSRLSLVSINVAHSTPRAYNIRRVKSLLKSLRDLFYSPWYFCQTVMFRLRSCPVSPLAMAWSIAYRFLLCNANWVWKVQQLWRQCV